MSIASKEDRRIEQLERWVRRNMKNYQYKDTEDLARTLILVIWEFQKDERKYGELWPKTMGSHAIDFTARAVAKNLDALRRSKKW